MFNSRFKYRVILPAPAPAHTPNSRPQHIPVHRGLLPPTDLYYDARWAAQRAMDAPRPKRIRASVNYAVPDELDDEIAAPAVAASGVPSSDTEIVASDIGSDSDSDEEFTTDKVSHLIAQSYTLANPIQRKLKAQKKKKAAKKSKKKVKKIKDVPFPFMELPPEIRFMIYKMCLVESARELSFVSNSTGRDVYRGTVKRSNNGWGAYNFKTKRERTWDANRTALQPVILRINKAIRDEAIDLLYSQTFHFATTHAFQQWFMRISPANRMLLRNIVIKGWTDYRTGRAKDVQHIFTLLMSAPNLRSILLDRHVWSENHGVIRSYHNKNFTGDARNFWRDIEYWADVMDAARGKGTAKAVLKFTKVCFGSEKEVEDEDEDVEKREKEFMAQLKFSEEAEQ
jgi:hypothetical protein